MATVDEIRKTIHEKIKQAWEQDFILEEDFDRQLSAIKTNLLIAIEEAKKSLGDNILETYREMAEKRRNINDTVLKFYDRTNSWVENRYWNEVDWNRESSRLNSYGIGSGLPLGLGLPAWKRESSPLNFYETDKIKSAEKRENAKFWELIRFAQKCLKGEDLSKTIRYFVNITGWTSMVIYLISKNRIVRLEIKDNSCNSNEHIIQKDIKKVEVYNEYVHFHYHGLHDAETLVMDNYEAAVNLRKEISELRESKFTFGKKSNRKH